MRSRLRLFALVGLGATLVDFLVLLILADRGLLFADVIALVSAALWAYLGNRYLTFRSAPRARWVREPSLFAITAIAAGLVDTLVLVLADRISGIIWLSKAVAIMLAAGVRWTAYRLILFKVVRGELAERIDRPQYEAEKRLSVVVPSYNEGQRVGQTIVALRTHLVPIVGEDELEILVVDDGSSDDTVEIAKMAGASVLKQDKNRGKGAAVRAGVIAAKGQAVVFTDADLAYSPEMVVRVLEEIENGWDVAVGSRRHDDTTTLVRARRLRELGGRLVNWLTHLVLLGHFRDTQCGIKGFRGDIGRVIFERCQIDGFAFDVEIFLISELDRLSLIEVPVTVVNRQASSVRLANDTFKLVRDLFTVRRAAGGGYYTPSDEQKLVIDNGRKTSDRLLNLEEK